jgi:hypothetical protein
VIAGEDGPAVGQRSWVGDRQVEVRIVRQQPEQPVLTLDVCDVEVLVCPDDVPAAADLDEHDLVVGAAVGPAHLRRRRQVPGTEQVEVHRPIIAGTSH